MKPKHTKQSAGQRGGRATVARHGRQHMQAIGRRGAQAFWQRYHFVPAYYSAFAIVERNTAKMIALTNYTPKQTAMSQYTHGGLAEGTSHNERNSRNGS